MNSNCSTSSDMANEEKQENIDTSSQLGPPHEALFLVLSYLPVFELLAMSLVCRALRDALENDILPWLNITIDKPLNTRLCDDTLMKITSRANGHLKTLALLNCIKITDDGLQCITEKNPNIEKLFVPGCTGLTTNAIITVVKMLPRLKILKINGIYNMNRDDLQTLTDLIGVNPKQGKQPINLYHNRNSLPLRQNDIDPSIDVDVCPKCSDVRMVFDCPRKSCQNQQQVISCRGCSYCIPRCEECGLCIRDDEELGDVACADTLCLDCWLRLPKCSFCNKPYCKQHSDRKLDYPGSSGFLCEACHAEFTKNLSQLH